MNANAQTNESNIVNGLNVDDLFALIEGVKGDVSKATTRWRVATTWQGQTRSRAEVEGFSIGGEDVLVVKDAGELGFAQPVLEPLRDGKQAPMVNPIDQG